MAIILMALGHSGCGIPYVKEYIYMFHMPLFFFLSGFCFNCKYLKLPWIYLWKRIKRLYWPYVKYGLIFLWLRNVFFTLHIYDEQYGWINHRITVIDGLKQSANIILHMGGVDCLLAPFWFLRALFFGTVIAYCAKLLFKNTLMSSILCLFLAILFNHTKWFIPILHPQIFAASFLFLIGYSFAEYKMSRFSTIMSVLGLIITFVGIFFCYMEMGNAFYDNIRFIPYLIIAIIATWSLKSLFERWNEQPSWLQHLLSFAGKNTMAVLTFNYLALKIVSYLIVFFNNLPIEMVAVHPILNSFAEQGWWIAYFIVGIAVPLGYAYIKRMINSNKIV